MLLADRHHLRLGSLALACVAASCTKTPAMQPPVEDDSACYACHGDPTNKNPAPPPLNSDPGAPRDAHQAHLLTGSSWHADVACEACHVVPRKVSDVGHVDTPLPAELAFSGVAVAKAATATYDFAAKKCSGTYCHGGAFAEDDQAGDTSPVWTTLDGTQDACGTCHGLPPGGDHPQNTACEKCHGNVVDATKSFVNPALHIDGQVEVSFHGCDSCHGGDGNPAPPKDTLGNTATTAVGVGAHRQHLGESSWHATVTCVECHQVPVSVSAPGHMDTPLPAELTWGERAKADGANPDFSGTDATCSGVYCHGATLTGGSTPTPTWTEVSGAQLACDTCHGTPPGGTHPARNDCSMCHAQVVDANRNIINASLHIDGTVEKSFACDSCHGGGGSAAPPIDIAGETATSAMGVGAHREHLNSSDWHAPVTCDQCHLVPAALEDPGHIDSDLPAELTWGSLAKSDSAVPQLNNDATCSVYCHGETLEGGPQLSPAWTSVTGTALPCDSCHGTPPGGKHPPRGNCVDCHPQVVDASRNIINASLHIDGTVEKTLACDSCHGSGGIAAPPLDVAGNQTTDNVGVGAHRQHLGTSAWHAEVLCDDCHAVPVNVDDPGHNDTDLPAELTWSAKAKADSAVPQLNIDSTCSGVYCHGATLDGGATPAPTWTVVGGTQLPCNSCHGTPPGGAHPVRTDCEACHGMVASSSSTIVAGGESLHINGTVDKASECNACHGDATQLPTDSLYWSPPVNTWGQGGATDRGVGAHRQHLAPSTWHAPILCSDCHTVPAGVDDLGHLGAVPAEIDFISYAGTCSGGFCGSTSRVCASVSACNLAGVNQPGVSPVPPAASYASPTCTNVYCHGGRFKAGFGGSNTTPDWYAGGHDKATQCGTCHGTPPGGTHSTSTNCNNCHGAVINADNVTFVNNGAGHINGKRN